MRKKLSFITPFLLLACLSGSRRDPVGQDSKTNLQQLQSETLEAARVVWAKLEGSRTRRSPEVLHRWSCRLLNARIGASKDKRGTAYEEHHKRMKVLQSEVQSLHEAQRASALEAAIVGYYVAEAKLWIKQSGRDSIDRWRRDELPRGGAPPWAEPCRTSKARGPGCVSAPTRTLGRRVRRGTVGCDPCPSGGSP
jgi:hypothetical protein